MKLFKALPAWAAALAMLFAPALALAQADATNTIPSGGIFDPSGRFQSSPQVIYQGGKDSVTGKACLVGFAASCIPLAGYPYTETTVTVTGGAWTLIAAANAARRRLVVGDATGLACLWSHNASPVSGEGFPFSTSSQGGSWVFDDPISTNAVYVKCTTGGVVTVAGA
jgi:hypothetical protein